MAGWFRAYAPVAGELISVQCYCHRKATDPQCTCGTGPKCKDHTYIDGNGKEQQINCSEEWICEDCCKHYVIVSAGGCCPLDISSTAGTDINCVLKHNIRSAVTFVTSGACGTETGDINKIVKVELHRNWDITEPDSKFGEMAFCHVANVATANGQLHQKPAGQTSGRWSFPIGQICSKPAGSLCYLSEHIHTQASGGGMVDRRSDCGKTYDTGNWIYKWPHGL